MEKKILGLSVSAPTNGSPGAIGWAFAEQSADQLVGVTERDVMAEARAAIGRFVEESRNQKGISPADLARSIGVSIQDLRLIEEGAPCSFDVFLKIMRSMDLYIFFKDRGGKHLDQADLIEKAKDLPE